MQREEKKDRSVGATVALRVTEAGSHQRRLQRPDGNRHWASDLLLGLKNISLLYFCFITVLFSDHTPQTM